jgi:phage-related protein
VPRTDVVFYEDTRGHAPVVTWLQELRQKQPKAFAKCVARIRLLADLGYELRRPHADFLRDGIYELRAKEGRVNYRILYFFHGQDVAVLAHALTKESKMPDADINRAVRRKEAFGRDPEGHTYDAGDDHG